MRTVTSLLTLALLLGGCNRGPAAGDTTAANARDTAPAPQTPSAQPAPDSMPTEATSITLRTDRQSYRAGDQVALTLTNPTDNRYTYNACTRVLEREEGGVWLEVREDRMCTMIAMVLDAKSTRTDTTDVGADLQAGRYRVVLALTEDAGPGASRSVRVRSAPIGVTR